MIFDVGAITSSGGGAIFGYEYKKSISNLQL